ncbi:MAG: hypothetical protein EXS02_15055 [Planctomycetes bacterium]|nr:hypothetical protein [Planctomycetota bacterium]
MRDEKPANPFEPMRSAAMCGAMCGAMPRIVQQPVIDALLLRRHVDRVQDGGVLLGPFRVSLPSSARRIGIGCIVCLAAATRIAI